MRHLLILGLSFTLIRAAERPPNIVFILADDLGITDIGTYAAHFTGAKPEELFYETHHLDKTLSARSPAKSSFLSVITRIDRPSGDVAPSCHPSVLHQ